jgi:catechol 2,3-dioxygenase-like lactoylglutathione lyase family enzyme
MAPSEDEQMSSSAAAPIRLEAAVPQFTVPSLVGTAEYYRDVLGFRIAGYYGTPPAFAIVRRDEVELFFNRADQSDIRTGRARGSYDAYFHLVGVEALAAELRARGADILEGPVVRSYEQRELVIRDCNGLVLAFGEDTTRRAT